MFESSRFFYMLLRLGNSQLSGVVIVEARRGVFPLLSEWFFLGFVCQSSERAKTLGSEREVSISKPCAFLLQ